jgi:hypothetical protein
MVQGLVSLTEIASGVTLRVHFDDVILSQNGIIIHKPNKNLDFRRYLTEKS